LADNEKAFRVRPGVAIGAGVMGVVTASIGVVTPPAFAVDYPSWNDVQQAKASLANQQVMVNNITTLITGLQSSVDAARIQQAKAAEAYLEAKDALATATAKADDLGKQADAAAEKAKTSQMRAGLLASHLAKSGGGDVAGNLMLKGSGSGAAADKLLYQLGTMNKLTDESKRVYEQATTDKNTAGSLTAQAKVAKTAREGLAAKASSTLAEAEDAQARVEAALATQQAKSTELVAQLATLKNTTAQTEAAYLQGEQIKAAAAAAAAAKAKAEADAAAAAAAAAHPKPPASGGGGTGAPVPPPNGNVVETAIAYANAQRGKPYALGGAGPNTFDCSGLTMKAYAYAGLSIGSHSVNDQWRTLANRGKIVPYSQRQRGDLIFWGDGPGTFYHIGIYIGNGQMIAAPQTGDVVKQQAVWGSPWQQVARPG
jgi:cell wall-associated NlpC family hydrolase